ncbi:hypothetical protein EJ03DRAFT_326540 [Teratosphaeria nubilosa]|uniref:Uncharacterized protein n=1 Tax=Teratosphaeria nubilosa TaxID=161662 RepID=A0A6G1LBU8_9PEZI|nr:hypothetical protein EJ03DRAFT_326540 [Teratosphaeria nubilosa]
MRPFQRPPNLHNRVLRHNRLTGLRVRADKATRVEKRPRRLNHTRSSTPQHISSKSITSNTHENRGSTHATLFEQNAGAAGVFIPSIAVVVAGAMSKSIRASRMQ